MSLLLNEEVSSSESEPRDPEMVASITAGKPLLNLMSKLIYEIILRGCVRR